MVAFVLACSTSPPPPPSPPLPRYDDMLALAGQFSASGNDRVAMEIYRHAAEAEPARKESWQHIARMHLAAGRPGLALVAAEEVLQRDPADAMANEMYVSSALEIARQAMQRLLASGATPDTDDRARAQQLVEMMGLVFGDDALIRDEVKAEYARRAVRQYIESQAPAPRPRPPEQKKPRDPLEVLGGD